MVNHNTASSQRCLLQNRIKILIKKELRQDIRHDFVSWQAVSHVTLQVQAHKNVARERLTHWGLQLSLEEWPSNQLDEKGRHLSMIDGTFQRTFSSFLFFILLKWLDMTKDLSGSQPPRWPSMILFFMYSCSCVVSSHPHRIKAGLGDHGIWWRWGCVTFQAST